MAILFDGKRFSKEKEIVLSKKVLALKKKGITPRLETILDGSNPASKMYVKLKKKTAERVGIEVDEYSISRAKRDKRTLIESLIRSINKDPNVHGVMVQLPLSGLVKGYTKEILETILPKKDVDGLRERSAFTPAAVKAVLEIIDFAKKSIGETRQNKNITVCVIGSEGFVGGKLVTHLKKLKYKVIEMDMKEKIYSEGARSADILISATGKPNLITRDMVKNGAIVVDVGSPQGDVSFNEVVGKASFITPVPGGVGPVTVVSLLENLVDAAYNKSKRISKA